MSKHPITPMNESDLRLHLAKQTEKTTGLINLLTLDRGFDVAREQLESLVNIGTDIILFDTITNNHVHLIGELIGSLHGESPVFIAGSSGVEYALAAYWQAVGLADSSPILKSVGAMEQILVMSGSASPVTKEQIEWAIQHGFEAIRLNTSKLVDNSTADKECDLIVQQSLAILEQGKSLILYATLGPDDPSIRATTERLKQINISATTAGERIGLQQGRIFRKLLENTNIKRACVAGGDTCGHTIQQLNIYALTVLASFVTGAPLCRVSSHNSQFNGLEIVLKGGQIGHENFFGAILNGNSGH